MMRESEMWETISKVPGMLAREECWLLYRLAQMAPPGGYLVELGTFQGRGAAVLALSGRGKVITIDNYSYAVKSSPKLVHSNLRQVGLKVAIYRGSSARVPAQVTMVSLLLVDTEHTIRRFRQEMRAWLPLILPNGIVVCHDFASSKWPKLTRAIRESLGDWQRVEIARKLVGFRKGE